MRFLRHFLNHFALAKRLSRLDSRIAQLTSELAESDQKLQRAHRRLDRNKEDFDLSLKRAYDAVEQSRSLAKKQQETITALQTELATANEIVIPTLTAANALFKERWESESHALALRRGIGLQKEME